ncbi:hypothetical protein C8F01DRAFT_1262863 [Mycena amicta]|nr:hypothetical protein C8F01DRAFT_1262863 [Mycena amicta]
MRDEGEFRRSVGSGLVGSRLLHHLSDPAINRAQPFFRLVLPSFGLDIVSSVPGHVSAVTMKDEDDGEPGELRTDLDPDADERDDDDDDDGKPPRMGQTSVEDHDADARKNTDKPKEFQRTSSATPRHLNDIAQAPPDLSALVRKAQQKPSGAKVGVAKEKAKQVLSPAQQLQLAQAREDAIRRYRELKAERSELKQS